MGWSGNHPPKSEFSSVGRAFDCSSILMISKCHLFDSGNSDHIYDNKLNLLSYLLKKKIDL